MPEHVTAFMSAAPVELQQARVLALHTGQREGDLLRLPWSAYYGNTIRLRQGNARRGQAVGRSSKVRVPRVAPYVGWNGEKIPVAPLHETGRAFKKRYFSHSWRRIVRQAGIEFISLQETADPVRLHFHDLRGTTVTLLSEAGCNPRHQILERYLARTLGLAEQAITNAENSPRTEFANQQQTEARAGKTRTRKNNIFNYLRGAPGEIRTPDPQIRSLVLYPAELRARNPAAVPSFHGRLGRGRREIAIGSWRRWQVCRLGLAVLASAHSRSGRGEHSSGASRPLAATAPFSKIHSAARRTVGAAARTSASTWLSNGTKFF